MSTENKDKVDVGKLTFEQLKRVRAYLKKMIEVGGSDLHIKANSSIRARIEGDLVEFSGAIFTHDESLTFAKEFLRGRFEEFLENK